MSENYLFHAYARYKYFTNSESHNRNLTNEEKSAMASEVVLAALAIPSVESSLDLAKAAGGAGGGRSLRQRESLMMEKAVDDSMASAEHFRNQHMANLLRFSANPSRAALIQELEAQGLLELATPAVRELYGDLEEKFHPLELVGKVAGNLEAVAVPEEFRAPLRKLIVLRLLKQLSAVYQSVKMEHFLRLLGPLQMERYAVSRKDKHQNNRDVALDDALCVASPVRFGRVWMFDTSSGRLAAGRMSGPDGLPRLFFFSSCAPRGKEKILRASKSSLLVFFSFSFLFSFRG